MRFKNFASKLDIIQNNIFGTPKISPSADRDVIYPKEPMWGTTVPVDINFADDTSNLIKQIQQSLKSGMLGVKYSGPVDGNINSILLQSVSDFENALEAKFSNKKFKGSIRFGTLLSSGGWNKALKAISELKKEEPKKEENNKIEQSNAEIIKFQKFFGLQPTGQIDQKLIDAAINAENNLIKELNEPSIKGMIWNSTAKIFETSLDDVAQAFKIMQNNKKTSNI